MVSASATPLRTHPRAPGSLALILVLYAAAAGLIVLALLHWKLRSGFSDTTNYIISMTSSGGFAIEHYRFIEVLYQWLPWLFVKAGAPLAAIGLTYSLGYTLAPVAMMALALHWLRQPVTALAIVLQFTLLNALLFYYTCSDLQFGLGLLFLYNGIYDWYLELPGRRRSAFVLATLLAVPLMVFAHPLFLPVLACWLLFRLLCRTQDRLSFAVVAAGFLLSAFAKKTWFTTPYEASKSLTWETVRPFGLNYFRGGLSRSFYSYVANDAFLLPVLLLLTIGLLIRQRNFRLLLTTLLSCGLLYLLLIIAFEDMNGMHIYDQYHEHLVQPAVFFLILGLTDAVFRLRMDRRLLAVACIPVIAISLAKINSGSGWLAYRQKWQLSYLRLMDRLGLKKAVAGRIWAPDGIWKGSFWNNSNETLFLSSLDGPEHSKTLFLVWNIADFKEPYQERDAIMMDGGTYPQATLPVRYFRLNDKPYVILEHTVPDSVLQQLRWP